MSKLVRYSVNGQLETYPCVNGEFYKADDVAPFIHVLKAIIAADERGQGLPFKEAMDEAQRLLEALAGGEEGEMR